MTMRVVLLIRQGVLVVTSLFSLIVLAISARLISLTQQDFNITAEFSVLAVVVAVITLVTLPVMFLVDFFRRGAFTSMIAVELAWLNILWILWVATAGRTFPFACSVYTNSVLQEVCQETQAVEAFSFLNFIILLVYTGFLFVMAVMAAVRGQSIWLSSVKEHFNSATPVAEHPMTDYKESTPGQQPAAQPQSTADKTQPDTAAVAV